MNYKNYRELFDLNKLKQSYMFGILSNTLHAIQTVIIFLLFIPMVMLIVLHGIMYFTYEFVGFICETVKSLMSMYDKLFEKLSIDKFKLLYRICKLTNNNKYFKDRYKL